MKEIENDNQNYGVYFLKIFMALEVVLAHCWGPVPENTNIILTILKTFRYVPVPVFMLLSFLLCYQKLKTGDENYIIKRVKRLMLPYVAWIIVYFVGLNFISVLTCAEQFRINKMALIKQLVSGVGFVGVVWFQLILTILTIILGWIFKHTKETATFLLFLLVIAVYMQYSGINYIVFSRFSDEIKYSIGRIFEMLPYAIAGTVLASFLPKINRESWKKICFISCLVILVLTTTNIFVSPPGFMFSGLEDIFLSISLILFFYYLPIEKAPKLLKNIVSRCGKYSVGVYFMHVFLRELFSAVGFIPFRSERLGNLILCLIIWGGSLFISWIISKTYFKFMVT